MVCNAAVNRPAPLLVLLAACGGSSPPPPDHAHAHGHEHGPLVHRFERAEDWATEFDDPARDAWQRPADVVAVMEISPGMTVADVGAGTGYFEPHLSLAVGDKGKVLALDLEPDMVRYIRERAARERLANVSAAVVAEDDPKLAPSSVDRILVVNTWHHIAARGVYAKHLRDALRPGGKLVVVDFTLEAKHGPPAKHRLAPEEVVKELAAAGLEASVVPTKLPEQYVVVGLRR